jgi:phage terminase large subunit-like protein
VPIKEQSLYLNQQNHKPKKMFPLHHYNDEPDDFHHCGAGRTHHAHLITMLFKATQSKHQSNVRAAHRRRLCRMII